MPPTNITTGDVDDERDLKDVETSDLSTMKDEPRQPEAKMHMMFYGISAVLFWSILLIQIPFISNYFGGVAVLFWVPLMYGLASNISRVVLMYFHSSTKGSTGSKLAQLVHWGASFTALGMFLFPVAMAAIGVDHPDIGFWICMAITAMVGFFNSFLVTGGFALMSIAPKGSGQFFLLGLTATGVVTWPFMMLLRLVTESAGAGDNTSFIVAIVSLVVTGVLCLSAVPVYKFCTSVNPFFRDQLVRTPDQSVQAGLFATFRKVWLPVVTMWVSRVATFALYPGMIGLWTPVSDAYSASEYQSFLIYMGPLSDTIGQLMYRYTRFFDRVGVKGLAVITVVRAAILIPLFLLSAKFDQTGSAISSDGFRCFLMFLFSFSMGINYSIGNAIAPQMVSSTEEKFTVGVILSFAAMNGLFVGSLVGIGFKELIVD